MAASGSKLPHGLNAEWMEQTGINIEDSLLESGDSVYVLLPTPIAQIQPAVLRAA